MRDEGGKNRAEGDKEEIPAKMWRQRIDKVEKICYNSVTTFAKERTDG